MPKYLWLFLSCVSVCMMGCGEIPRPGSIMRPAAPQAPILKEGNVIIVLADALRADRLGCYGCETPTSPVIDELAKSGFLFERSYAQAPWTKPSVASIFTGYVPSVHQAVVSLEDEEPQNKTPDTQVLREQFVTLAESFKQNNYATGLFMANGNCKKEYGFAQGFDHYYESHFVDPKIEMDRVLEWLDQAQQGPFFAFVHLRDPHGPYEPDRAWYDALYPKSPMPSETDLKLISEYKFSYVNMVRDKHSSGNLNLGDVSDDGVAYMKRLYDAEILGIDIQVKRLLDRLAALNIRDRTTVVILADHGEAFREHGCIGHGSTLYDEVLHVPLIVCPAGMSGATRVPWSVRLFDIYPSVLTLCGLPVPEGLQAETLFDTEGRLAVRGHRNVFSEMDLKNPDVGQWTSCIIVGPYKLIRDRASGMQRVYNRDDDPYEWAEGVNVPATAIADLRKTLFAQICANREMAAKFGPPQWRVYDEQTTDDLKALGYL